MKARLPRRRCHPLRAATAFITLLRGHERERAAVRFLQATEGTFAYRRFACFRGSSTGARLLQSKPSIFASVQAQLDGAAHAFNTLGAAFQRFQKQAGFTVDSILAFAEEYDMAGLDEDQVWFVERMHGVHDFQHVLTGYGADPLGEICLWHFRLATVWHDGAAALCALCRPMLTRLHPGADIAAALREARARGRAAPCLDDIAWEELLDEDLQALRSRFRVGPAPVHDAIMAARPRAVMAPTLAAVEA